MAVPWLAVVVPTDFCGATPILLETTPTASVITNAANTKRSDVANLRVGLFIMRLLPRFSDFHDRE